MKMLSTGQVEIVVEYVRFQVGMLRTALENNQIDSAKMKLQHIESFLFERVEKLEEHAIEFDDLFPISNNESDKESA